MTNKLGYKQTEFDRGEHRQLTVLFCDIVDSTSISESLPLDLWIDILRKYHSMCADLVKHHDGHVAQQLGDGFLAYFGYPTAGEESALQAVRAGLSLLESMPVLNAEFEKYISSEQEIKVRIAANSGAVALDGFDGTEDRQLLAFGTVPAVAARLQETAKPNSLVISESAYQLVHGSIKSSNLGLFNLKGISEPQSVFEVFEVNDTRQETVGQNLSQLSPFAGREDEIDYLSSIWRGLSRSGSRMIRILGDPGIGKSRLVLEFLQHENISSERVLFMQSSSLYKNTPLIPISDLLQSITNLCPGTGEVDSVAGKIASLADLASMSDDEIELLREFICSSESSSRSEFEFESARQKKKLAELVCRMIENLARARPLVLVCEDLHWIDPSTINFLKYFWDKLQSFPVFFLIASRYETAEGWLHQERAPTLALGPLDSNSGNYIAKVLAERYRLSESQIEGISDYTEGVPLFIEELVKMIALQHSNSNLPELFSNIPPSLQNLLMARLDNLGESKKVAQIAAVIGREFNYSLVRRLSTIEPQALDMHLKHLIGSGLVVQTDKADVFAFKHALVRDMAYESLPGKLLRKIHRAAGELFVDKKGAIEVVPWEIAAHHFAEAKLPEPAVSYWIKASKSAIAKHAHREAISHLRKANKIVLTVENSAEQLLLKLQLELLHANCLIVNKGWGQVEVKDIYSNARSIALTLGDKSRLLQSTLGLQGYYFMRAEFETAQKLAEECLEIADELGEPRVNVVVYWTLGLVAFQTGELSKAEQWFDRCVEQYTFEQHNPRTLQNPAVMSLCYLAWSQWSCGNSDAALASIKKALELAKELNHPYSIGVAKAFIGAIYLLRNEYDIALEFSDLAITYLKEHEMPTWHAFATIVNGWLQVFHKRDQDGLSTIQRGIELWSSSGSMVTVTLCYSFLAEAELKVGRISEAMRTVDRALEIAENSGEKFWIAEILRLRGEIFSRDDKNRSEAKKCFERAKLISSSQGALALEQRVNLSMEGIT